MPENNFNDLFDQWAPQYDDTVHDQDGEYQEVFEGYEQILDEVVKGIPSDRKCVLEFGVGTGNLTQKLNQAGFQVIGVEPSKEMRRQVQEKRIPVDLRAGSFLHIPLQQHEKVDAIVSTYAFHHLTYTEKLEALNRMKSFLSDQGLLLFADTAYANAEQKKELFKRVKEQKRYQLLQDLETEFYELVPDLEQAFSESGFDCTFTQLNRYVWLMHAKQV